MEYRRLGESELNVSALAPGTMIFGEQNSEADAHSQDYPEQLRRIRFKDRESGKTLVFLTNNTALPALTIAALYKSRWQVGLFSKWIEQHLRIKLFHRQQRECCEDENLVRRLHLRADRYCQKGAST
jgi:IS4 transposase